MNKIKFLTILVVGLLLSNLMLAGFLMYKKTEKPDNDRNTHIGPRNIIIEKLHFNENQVKQYDELIKWHRSEIEKAQGKLMICKNRLYNTLAANTIDTTLKKNCIEDIAEAQKNIEHIHYTHFEDIKKLCTSEQKQYYKQLTEEIAALFAPHRPKRP